MKKNLILTAILLFAIFMMGMGDLSGKPDGVAPIPAKDFKAIITDKDAVKTTCDFTSINGKDLLKGNRGATSVTIPFDNISSMKVTPSGNEKDVLVEIKLVDGETIKVEVDSNSDVAGKTNFGAIQVKMRDVSNIEFIKDKK